MAQILGNPIFQAFDNQGLELNGGAVYTYEGGTLIAVATYPTIADALAKTNANTNPVILDSAGRANIVIWTSTKVVVNDSLGNNIYTVDNVGANTGGSSNNIIDGNGNLLIDFYPQSSSVNNLLMQNAATGNAPLIGVEGTDTNINLQLNAKGNGIIDLNAPVEIAGNATLQASLIVTNNSTLEGTNILSGFTYPTTDGTAGQAIKTNGSKSLSFGNKLSSINVIISTTTGTYTPSTGCIAADFVVIGGGGGGGGGAAGSGTNQLGGGGGSGAITRYFATIAQIGTSAAFTIGAGGAGGSGITGTAGGATSIVLTGTGGLTFTANGGLGGVTSGNAGAGGMIIVGGAGGNTSGGDSRSTPGTSGGYGILFFESSGSTTYVASGYGASSLYGTGGIGVVTVGGSANSAAGGAASGSGAGGGGAYTNNTTLSGGNGSAGLILIMEYICA